MSRSGFVAARYVRAFGRTDKRGALPKPCLVRSSCRNAATTSKPAPAAEEWPAVAAAPDKGDTLKGDGPLQSKNVLCAARPYVVRLPSKSQPFHPMLEAVTFER